MVVLMPQVLQWFADPIGMQARSEAVDACRQILQAGGLALLPTEAGYAAFASASIPEAVARLAALLGTSDGRGVAVAVRGVAEAREWAPQMGLLGNRLARRCWPGPVILEMGTTGAAAFQSGGEAKRLFAAGDRLGLIVPGHPVIRGVLDAVRGPLIFRELADAVTTADAAVASAGGFAEAIVDGGSYPSDKPATVVEVCDESWSIRGEGAVSANEIAAAAAMLILFVCTGNTCRSPLAAALCKRRLADRLECSIEDLPHRGFVVASAGIAAIYGEPAAAEAVTVACELGAELNDHVSRPAAPDVLADADLIIGMTAGHLQAVEMLTGAHADVRLLCGDADLADPIGGNLEVYQGCAGTIWQHLQKLVEYLAPSGRG
jgi:protein-tyrosine-phosphatase/tRNA A37 threonylcarbamoyladenosine synthetase subunit TsaC/SUA5/YrdC